MKLFQPTKVFYERCESECGREFSKTIHKWYVYGWQWIHVGACSYSPHM